MAAAWPPRFPVSASALAAFASSMRATLLDAAYDGDLRLLKSALAGLVLGSGRGHPREAVEAARSEGGMWALPIAACNGQMEVCRYLVEVLRVDVNSADDEGRTPLVYAVISENTAVVKYLLDHGADPDKADDDKLTPLHSAAGLGEFIFSFPRVSMEVDYLQIGWFSYVDLLFTASSIVLICIEGDCEMIKLLLAKGAYVDPIADEIGTPLHLATREQQVAAMKTLLDHNADCNKTYMMSGLYPTTPLFEAVNVSSVECVKLLVEAGAIINSDCVSTLSLDSTMGNDGSTECLNFLLEACANCDTPDDEKHENTWKIALLKSFGSKAVKRKDFYSASAFYTKALDLDPNDATLFSNRSFCCLRMGDGEEALLDALKCRELRPDWPKACYRHGAALMLLEDYGSACKTLLDGLKLDPENAEIERALREAMESLKTSKGTRAR